MDDDFLPSHRTFRSADLDEVRSYIGTVFKPHALRTYGRSAKLDTVVNRRPAGPGSLVYFGYGGITAEVDPGPLDDFYLLQFACTGSGTMRYGARDVALDPRTSAAALSPQRPTRGRFNPDTRMLVARIDRHELIRHYVRHLGTEPATPLEFDPHIRLDTPAGMQLANVVRLIATRTDHAPGLGDAELQSLLCGTLMYVQPNTWRGYLLDQTPVAETACVRTVQEYLEAHGGEDLTVERLAALAGVSPRTLFASFRRSLGVAPMTYVRDVRLERAHRELGNATVEGVTEIALRCGFTHLGRFATDYRRKYGEAPSVTRRRATR